MKSTSTHNFIIMCSLPLIVVSKFYFGPNVFLVSMAEVYESNQCRKNVRDHQLINAVHRAHDFNIYRAVR